MNTKYLQEIMKGTDGNASFKRFATGLCVILITIAFLSNMFLGLTIEEFIFNGVMFIVISGLGFTGLERFAPRQSKGDETSAS